jgi:hypothetical protein
MNPNATNPNSGSLDAGGNLILPIRTQKDIQANTSFSASSGFQGQIAGLIVNSTIADDGQNITAALRAAYKDYVKIRIQGRGGNQPGVFDQTKDVYFHFLINPREVSISRSVLDEQSFTRGGWQVGLWGEDFIKITLSGKTPGQYYDGNISTAVHVGNSGLSDSQQALSMSYRNILALEILFENNGYWFEGEQIQSDTHHGSIASNWQIKSHQDVELTVGEYIWRGMFETMEISQDSAQPFLMDFTLSFIAWNEKFDTRTPYADSIGGEVQFGHVPSPGAVNQDVANKIAAQYASAPPANSGANIQTPAATVNSTIQNPSTTPTPASPTVFSPWTTN